MFIINFILCIYCTVMVFLVTQSSSLSLRDSVFDISFESSSDEISDLGDNSVDEKTLPLVKVKRVQGSINNIEIDIRNSRLNSLTFPPGVLVELDSSSGSVFQKCRTAQEAMSQLGQQILNRTSKFTTLNPMTCEFNYTLDCSNRYFLNALECQVMYFNKTYETALSKSLPLHEHWKLYEIYNDFSSKTQQLLRNQIKSTGLIRTKEINNFIGLLEKPLDQTIEDLNSKTVKYCIWEIQMGRAKQAVRAVKNRKGNFNTILSAIVGQAYKRAHGGRGQQNYQEILNFITNLPNCSNQEAAFQAFLDTIKQNNDEYSFEMFLFSETLTNSKCSPNFSDLKKQVHSFATNIARSWGADARVDGHNATRIYKFSRAHKQAFRLYIEDIIRKAFNQNIRNGENTIDFIEHLPYKTDDVLAYKTLFDEMRTSSGFEGHEIIMVAQHAYMIAQDPGAATTSEDVKALSDIRNKLPDGIRALIWNPFIEIKSKAYPSNYLGFRVNEDGESDNRTLACPESSGFKNEWSVEAIEKGRYFKFTNQGTNASLVSSADDGDIEYTDHWQITPMGDGNLFYFRNRGTWKILEAGGSKGQLGSCMKTHEVPEGDWSKNEMYWSIH